tara:strand:- start:17984 stop:20383 length:2400 start_codon:yes stop_codon:yes gene_type:complete
MSFRIKKVVVLGSGVMGSGIACHLANVEMEVLMLDVLPSNLKSNSKDKKLRNSIADEALQKAIKSKPSPLYERSYISRISTGNFTDNFKDISDADWIIEVVVENLEIKKNIFEKVDANRKKKSLVTSNTSSIPINLLAEGRSKDFKKHFCGTHFFNPPRYLRLLEIIPISETEPKVIDFFMKFGDVRLGKQTVLCKDTPAFIANRIGVVSGTVLTQLTLKYKMSIEEVDSLTGTLIGRPNTATFRLQDLVGIDTSDKVTNFVSNAAKDDVFFENLRKIKTPTFMKFLLENKFYGNKSGKGYYEKTKEKDSNGRTIVNALNLETLKYLPVQKPKLKVIKEAKSIQNLGKRLNYLVSGNEREQLFLNEYFTTLFDYTGQKALEISLAYYQIDDAMRTGYVWDYGPFELWDLIGFDTGTQLIKKSGSNLPDWIKTMKENNASSFYKFESGKKKYFDLNTKKYLPVPSADNYIILDSYRENKTLIKNSECCVHDIGDGVMCLEFTSKSNSIGEGIGHAINDAINMAEDQGWNGIVIGNNAKQFSVGANLMNIGMLAMQKQFDNLDNIIEGFQALMMRIRTSKIPIVVATQGYVFGGGCEIAMHCDAGVYAAESYIGLPEVGVGLLPAGGGVKELAMRASDKFFDGDVKIPTLIEHFKTIATATIATSAYEAYNLSFLQKGRDTVCTNIQRNIGEAKKKVLSLSLNYIPPSIRNDIEVLGRSGLSVLYSAINEFYLGGYMSEYDVEIARKVAFVICGGDLTSPQNVSETYLLEMERESMLFLLGKQKTLDRIQYLLMNNKPLRN